MIITKIKMLAIEKIESWKLTPIYKRIYLEGIESMFDDLETLEMQARTEAWKEGWASAVKFGTELYFCKEDAEHFLKARTKLLKKLEEDPEMILVLMPSIIDHITQGTDD